MLRPRRLDAPAIGRCVVSRRGRRPLRARRAGDEREDDMNWDQVQGNWEQMKGKAREKWGEITDDEMTEIGGRKDQLIGKIQAKYGSSRADAERESDDWAASLRDDE
jgi:uncharacterized protein YjbJ (UPF0337 family)